MRRWLIALALCAACGAPAPSHPSAVTPAATPEAPASAVGSGPSDHLAGAAAGPSTATTAPAASAPPPAPAPVELLQWTRSLDKPATSLAIGKRRIAVYGNNTVWMRDAGAWRELPLPEKLRPSGAQIDRLTIYFGRDDRPRLMGYRDEGGKLSQRYYRWKGNWRGKPGEIGRLDADPPAALYGILGHDDPEVVCKSGDTCIIKRLTGWTMVPVLSTIALVEIAAESAFAINGQQLLRIDKKDKAFKVVSDKTPWKAPTALWPLADGSVWVADGRALHHFSGSAWRSDPAPLEVRTIWAAKQGDVWAGGEGLLHHDGKSWRRVAGGPSKTIHDIQGFKGELWVVADDGVWVGSKK